ncbi:MAG: (2Fe-2S)-binding protein [Bacteroidota bacterium]
MALSSKVDTGVTQVRTALPSTCTKYGCGVSACGACSVHVDGKAVRSCVTPVSTLEGKAITTIEGVAKDGQLSAVQRAWIIQQVPQCGFCQSGMIMAVESMLDENAEPTDEDINKTITNICRCGTYQRVREAIALAVEYRKGAETNLS